MTLAVFSKPKVHSPRYVAKTLYKDRKEKLTESILAKRAEKLKNLKPKVQLMEKFMIKQTVSHVVSANCRGNPEKLPDYVHSGCWNESLKATKF
jgi:hypothetical protein